MGLLEDYATESVCLDSEDAENFLEDLKLFFDVWIDPYDLEHVGTVGDIADLIEKNLDSPPTERFLSAYVFFEIRKALVEQGVATRREIRPSTEIESILPQWRRRRKQWHEVARFTALDIPPLRHSGFLSNTLLGCSAIGSFVVVAIDGQARSFGEWLMTLSVTVMAALLAYTLLLAVTYPWFAIAVPNGCRTFGDLAQVVLGLNHGKVAKRCGGSNRREILSTIRALMAFEFDLDPNRLSRYTPLF